VENRVVGHRRYANLARLLNMPCSPGNIMHGKQATQKAHRDTLRQSPKELHAQKQQILGGKLVPLE